MNFSLFLVLFIKKILLYFYLINYNKYHISLKEIKSIILKLNSQPFTANYESAFCISKIFVIIKKTTRFTCRLCGATGGTQDVRPAVAEQSERIAVYGKLRISLLR